MGEESDIREEIEETRDRMGETIDAITYKTNVPDRMRDAVSDRLESVKSTVGAVRDRAAGALPDPDDVRDVGTNAMGAVRENPLGLFFGALAVGFLAGWLVPASDIENERLGPIGDQLKQTAQAASGQILEQGKAVVRDTVDAAKQSAMEHGSQVGQSTMQSVKDSTS